MRKRCPAQHMGTKQSPGSGNLPEISWGTICHCLPNVAVRSGYPGQATHLYTCQEGRHVQAVPCVWAEISDPMTTEAFLDKGTMCYCKKPCFG